MKACRFLKLNMGKVYIKEGANCESISKCVISDDVFFIVGICALLTSELIDEQYYIIDINQRNLQQINKYIYSGKKVVAFITSDLDYFSLSHLSDVIFINKKWCTNEILSCLFIKNSRHSYRMKFTLSTRESEVLSFIQKGIEAREIGRLLGISIKTFYTHRRNLMSKLKLDNRLALYRNVTQIKHL